MKTQFGMSKVADFSKNTWTFIMPEGFKISSGEFAIVSLKEWSENTIYPSTIETEMTVAIKQKEADFPENCLFWNGKIEAYKRLLAIIK